MNGILVVTLILLASTLPFQAARVQAGAEMLLGPVDALVFAWNLFVLIVEACAVWLLLLALVG